MPCGQGRGRTADLPIFSRSLVPTELPGRAPKPYNSRSVAAESHTRVGRRAPLTLMLYDAKAPIV